MIERQPEPVTPVYEEPNLGLTPDQVKVTIFIELFDEIKIA